MLTYMYLPLFVIAPFRSPKFSSAKDHFEGCVIQGVEIPCQELATTHAACGEHLHIEEK